MNANVKMFPNVLSEHVKKEKQHDVIGGMIEEVTQITTCTEDVDNIQSIRTC